MGEGHLQWEEIVDGVDRVAEHVARCEECREALRRFERVMDGLDTWRGMALPPEGYADRVIEAVQRELLPKKDRGEIRQIVEELIAEVVADSHEVAAGVRAAASAPVTLPRTLAYETPRHTVALRIGMEEGEETLEIRGQVLQREPVALVDSGVAILTSLGAEHRADLTDLGEFFLRGIPRGPVALSIEVEDVRLVLGTIPVGGDGE